MFATLLGVCHDLLVEPQFAIEHEVNGEGIRGRGIGMFENMYSVWMTVESDAAFSSDWRKLLIIARILHALSELDIACGGHRAVAGRGRSCSEEKLERIKSSWTMK